MTIDSVKKMKDALCEKLKVSFGSTVEEASDAQMMRASALVPVSYTHLDVYKRQRYDRPASLFHLPRSFLITVPRSRPIRRP